MTGGFPTQRSISQIIRRHTPGSLLYLDEHGLVGRVRFINGEQDPEVEKSHLYTRFVHFLERWVSNGGTLRGIDTEITIDDVTPVAPDGVVWEPYPPIYRCSDPKCQVLHDADDADFAGTCRRCGSELRQMPYVYYHHCGTLSYLKPPGWLKCPQHGRTYLYLHDTGRFFTSKWRCRECDFEQDFFFPYCRNPKCKQQTTDRPRLQGSFWNDQWVHYSQTLDYINLDESLAERFLRTERGRTLLLRGGVLGQVPAGNKRLLQALEGEGTSCPKCGSTVTPGWQFCPACGTELPEGLWDSGTSSAIARYPVASTSGRCAWGLLRDMEASRSLRDVATAQANDGDPTSSDPYRWGLERAEAAGIWDVVLVTSFPLTTAAVGYTRYQSGPPNAWFRPFPRSRGRQGQVRRYPLYTQSIETEAWLVQIRATALARWIIANRWQPWAAELAGLVDEAGEVFLKEWFIEQMIPVAEDEPVSPEQADLYARVEVLLHSLSHVTLLALALHSGMDATSLGEMLMTDALGFAIYTGGSDLGALTAAFRQLAGVVFISTVEEYASCKFDPSCRHDDGGACVGCIQLYRGCQLFNDNLSRAFLFGGPTGNLAPGEVQHGFFAAAQGGR